MLYKIIKGINILIIYFYMPFETFISKYKPYYIKDFCVTNEFKNVLNTLIEIDQLNILFIGNSNSGKTTLINSLIREYYDLNINDSFPDSNILFVNNLKEQGIQYFRNEMKTFCQSRCSIFGKKKLVLIDDIDTINEQSQQVFRNYIDKYKQNIHFISVCSNVQKVVESIQSRLHIIQIPHPTKTQIMELLNKITTEMDINIDEESKQYLFTISNYSIRMMITYLEKMYIYGEPINISLCNQICSTISFQEFEKYLTYLKNNQLNDAIQIMYHIHDYGYSVIDILDYLFAYVKFTDIIDEELKYKITCLLCKYITIFNNIHEDCIELALFTNNLYKLFI